MKMRENAPVVNRADNEGIRKRKQIQLSYDIKPFFKSCFYTFPTTTVDDYDKIYLFY